MPRTSEELAQEIEVCTTSVSLAEDEREALRRAAAIIRIRRARESINARLFEVQTSTDENIENDYVSVDEVADMFGISVQGVYKWIKLGKIEVDEFETPGGKKTKSHVPSSMCLNIKNKSKRFVEQKKHFPK